MTGWLRLADGDWAPAGPPRGAVAAADSWLVEDGCARGADLHWARFARGCAAAGVAVPAGLRAAVEHALPVTGRWWPRVEARADGELRLAVRPAPARQPTVAAWVSDRDPREAPARKGPDLERLGALRAEAARHGAEEALLADPGGCLLEGAYTSLLWWEDDALCAVPDDAAILDGVTRRLLLGLAPALGVAVRHRRPAPAELAGREVWLTNAVHGIRVVRAWADDAPAGEPRRAAAWQARLEALAEPLRARARVARPDGA
ncbi:MAG TPA: aminotransferase class IV [Solirubrobacteraceae bacterium]|nr:aminotransferase class IV [Solirubrobacteraceae bacterium]